MTFKEKLVEKAKQISIKKEIDQIIEDMDKFASYREYFIKLYDAHIVMAIGSSSGFSRNESQFFVPGNISGEEYTNLFVKELKEFGFNENDLHLEVIKCKEYDLYIITVRW